MHMSGDPRCVPLGMMRAPGQLGPAPGVPGLQGGLPPNMLLTPAMLSRPPFRLPPSGVGRGGGFSHIPSLGPGPGPGPPQIQAPGQNIYVEDHMDHLAGKLDMLENELRYAWRALDVLSQEYIKMWERMEKLEGLLTEQQTVITQLIDLYTADSSDNAENEFDSNGRDISNFSNFGGKAPDESFYKALNMVHQNSYPNPAETINNVTNIANFNTANSRQNSRPNTPKSTKSPKPQPKGIEYIDNFNIIQQPPSAPASLLPGRLNPQVIREDSEGDLKSMSSSMRSTQSGVSDVAEFPVPQDTSPTYENLMSAGTLVTAVANGAGPAHKRKLPQLPGQTENRRTRKDGYVGDQGAAATNKPLQTSEPNIPGQQQSVTNVFPASAGNVQSEVSYDTYPRRKKKKDKQQKKKEAEPEVSADSPLTVIDGNYSFNISGDMREQSRQEEPGDNKKKSLQDEKEIRERQVDDKQVKAPTPNRQNLLKADSFTNVHQQQPGPAKPVAEDTPSDNSLTRASANSLFQQIQAREAETGKTRKLSLKEKRKLRAERDLTEFLPRSVEVEEPPTAAPVFRKHDHSNSESDVSMRSDISPKRDSDDVDQLMAANGPHCDQQGGQVRPRSNGGLSLLQPSASVSQKGNSREFAVSRALGKYRQKKKERESSNSDSQDELEMVGGAGIESTLKSLDAKLAEIEESVEPVRSISVTDAKTSIPPEKVQNQLNKFEEAGTKPIEPSQSASRPMSRKVSQDSIDTDDEWYRHEMMRLKKMESEQKAGGVMNNLMGELNRKLVPGQTVNSQDVSKVGQPPDRPPGEPPDRAKTEATRRIQRRSSKKQLVRKSTSEKSTEDDSSLTGSADDDSDTQSGEDFIEEEEEEYLRALKAKEAEIAAMARPGNLSLSQAQPLNISGNLKPDLLVELTAAAAEDHYPEHLKHGYFGEDGIWYDEHGETGYWGEDGEWYDYLDEIGYYDNDGEWQEYDYSKGYWDDEGEWKLKEAPTQPQQPVVAAASAQNPGKEADHFLWVSEEGTNEFANDQVPSSELTTRMVIGKPASGFTEAYCQQHSDNNTINNNNNSFVTNETYSEPEEETIKPTAAPQQQPNAAMNHVSQIQLKQLQHHQQQLLQQQQKIIEEIEEEEGGGGGRWGAIMTQKKLDILLLVRQS